MFGRRALEDAVGLGFLGKEVLLVVGVVQADLVVVFLGPEAGAAERAGDAGRDGVEILRVAHGVAVGVLVVSVSAWSWVERLIVIDRILHGTRRPLGDGLVYVF